MPRIKAKVPFAHDALSLNTGETGEVSAATAKDLYKNGLIHKYSGADEEEAAEQAATAPAADKPATTTAQDTTTKMAGDVLNKKAPEPLNKTAIPTVARKP